MFMNTFQKLIILIQLSLLLISTDFALQNKSGADSVDITIIDSYVTPDMPTFLSSHFFY